MVEAEEYEYRYKSDFYSCRCTTGSCDKFDTELCKTTVGDDSPRILKEHSSYDWKHSHPKKARNHIIEKRTKKSYV